MKPSPSYKNGPDAMNPAADSVWRWVVKHYSSDIYESKLLVEQWRRAKAHFERICSLKKIEPYDTLTAMAVRLERIARNLGC